MHRLCFEHAPAKPETCRRRLAVLACSAALTAACSANPSNPGSETPTPPDAAAGYLESDAGAPNEAASQEAGASMDNETGTGTGNEAGVDNDAGQPAGNVFAAFPLVTPPVKAAAPAGFGGSGFTTQSLRLSGALPQANPLLSRADLPRFDESRLLPSGFAAGGGFHLTSLNSSDIKSRFFTAGPTDIYMLLGSIDDRISGINSQAQMRKSPCLSQTPVAYVITPFGQSITFYAQCYQQVGSSTPGDPGFVQFGEKDGITYYYSAIGAGWTAAMLRPTSGAATLDGGVDAAVGAQPDADGGGTAEGGAGAPDGSSGSDASGGASDASGQPDGSGVLDGSGGSDGSSVVADGAAGGGPAGPTYIVQAWSGVGYLNAAGCGNKNGFDDCSYGVIQLQADSSKRTFEMSVAGIGFGYCGAQLTSDGTNVYGVGSPDMGTTCAASDTFCVAASDVTTPATCASPLTTFVLPALGRVSSMGPNAGGPGVDAGSNASWAASQYPGGTSNRIRLDGTMSDSLYFGPTSPTPGVSAF